MNVLRCAIYCRVSTDKQEEKGNSLPYQERACRELADRDGYEVVRVYSDALSGSDPARPQYRAMLDAAARMEFEAVVFLSMDRFGRDTIESVSALKALRLTGVKVLSVRRGEVDTSTPEGRMMATIEAAFNEMEREKIRLRTIQGIASKKIKGVPHGRSFGYDVGPDGHWIVNEAQKEALRRALRYRVEDGMSYHAIAARLNREGQPTMFGKPWSAPSVKRVIESKACLGYFNLGSLDVECPTCGAEPSYPCKNHKGEVLKNDKRHSARKAWIKGRHPAIVDVAIWEAAQAMIPGNDKVVSRPGRKPRRHLFINGHLRCVRCGSAMQTRSGKTPEEDQYVCATHRRHVQRDGDTSSCPTGWHKREPIDRAFLALFERSFLDYDATRAKVSEALDEDLNLVQSQTETADLEVARIERWRQKLDADYKAEELGAAAYTRLSEQAVEELTAAMNQRELLHQRADQIKADRENVDVGSETLRRLTALRDTVASLTRNLNVEVSADLDALRGVLQAAFQNVYLDFDGTIVAMTPGARMNAQAGAFSMPVQVIGDAPFMGVEPGGQIAANVQLQGDVPELTLDAERMAVPLIPSVHGESNVKVARRTL